MTNDIQISVIDTPQYGFYDGTGKYVRGAYVPHTQTLAWVAEYIRTQASQETATLQSIPRGEKIPVKRKQRMHDGSFVDYTRDIERAKHYKATHFKRAYFGGVFRDGFKASNIVQHSHVFVLDFDGHDNPGVDMNQARQALQSDNQVQPLLLFTSPSGDGLKMICNVPFDSKAEWQKRLQAIWHYLFKTYGIRADEANKDICRGCYLPHDANVYVNPQARTLLDFNTWFEAWEQEHPKQERQTATFDGQPLAGDAQRAAWYAEQLELKHIDVTTPQSEWARMGFAIAELGEQGRSVFHVVSRAGFIDYNFEECERMFDYCQATRTGAVGLATFIDAAISAIGTTYEKEHKTTETDKTPSAKTHENIGQSIENKTNTMENEQKPEPAAAGSQEQNELVQTMFKTPTLKEIAHAFGHIPPGIPTAYTFGIGDEQEKLTLPNQALTIIAARTSGGKTRMLENIALQVAKQNTEQIQGETLFFTLEEPATDVLIEMANIAHNKHLTWNGAPCKNADIIRIAQRVLYKQQMATTDEEMQKSYEEFAPFDSFNETLQEEFDEAVAVIGEFWATYLQPRNIEHHNPEQPLLRIYGDEQFCNVKTMCEAVRKYQEQGGKCKAIFIDYLGMFRTNERAELLLPKTERIERMLNELEQLAKDVNAPVVISAQLKREKTTPWEMQNSSVADSTDIENSCNTMILLWNSREHFDDTAQQANLAKAGFVADTGGNIFARMTKRRGGIRNGAVVLRFDENTGKIEQGTGVDYFGNTDTPAEQATTPGTNAPAQPGTTTNLPF